jgi:hypothetical protein
MALLRKCLQELRTKHPEWDVQAGGWPEPRPMLQQPLPEFSPLVHAERHHGRRQMASHHLPTA